jgi:hypothetical protein
MEVNLTKTLELFTKHINALELKKPGCAPAFSLSVCAQAYDKKVQVQLNARFYNNKNYEDVQAGSFDALINEVWRRLGFADKQALEIDYVENALLALPDMTGETN